MVVPNKGIFVVGAKRTPFCKYGGSLRELTASYIFATAAKGAIQSAELDPSIIDHTFVGNVNYLSQCDGGKTPRYCGIYSGVPIDKPALGVNKACGSGLQAVINGALEILTGLARVSLTGGTEQMTSLPHLVRNVRFGATLGGSYQFEDHITTQFVDSRSGLTLQKVAEELAKNYNVTREDADKYASESRLKWKAAQTSNVFVEELVSVTATMRKKEITVSEDEVTDDDSSLQGLEALQPTLIDGSVVTAGNSAAPADGAASLLLTDEETVTRHQLRPLARVAGWACVGGDPESGLGAVTAVERLLEVTRVKEVDLFEISDMFASQAVVTSRQLNIDPDQLNVSGGALTLGHPVAASGARIAVHMVHELRRRNLKTGVVASSCGGGQGIALLLENM
ncbi:3-ketoacyl-CoA thiolase, mitochondrial-like [Amyelois transitella]|uniref:3-ketoacyl-CoA thiolase, mitochondrial-like n=1 Tax=Amyelois transitella TaxID=680683 RepID=UPI00299081FC|nr:3-ketoacyl-CoA thiolase, mitochondrial-like [Amyelois transitella]